ncbi:hypothetical protein [Chromobacterium sp. Beijing]|uniref:hypothetical protein n=1 Tax=Chromobacterium sp. Beijing TaxID=2735795 RepID=UPI001F21A125|nr:hypothetical protein [Chromobacterium sp. Beijing]
MASPVSYIEIGAGDAAPVGAFFAELFGWSFHPMGTDGGGWFQAGSIKAGLHGGMPRPGSISSSRCRTSRPPWSACGPWAAKSTAASRRSRASANSLNAMRPAA